MERLTGGEAIVRSLVLHGVDTVFGIPGVQTYGLFDALYQARDKIRFITTRHEQAAAYMAYGYAKASGKTGVFTVVPGPGLLNTLAAVCTAYGTSTPIVCVTGEVPAADIGSGAGHLHELPDQLATMRTLMKWAACIHHPSQAPALVNEAFRQANGGRPRPVGLEMPWDVFSIPASVELLPPEQVDVLPHDPVLIDQAAALIKAAHNPLIMVGSGAIHAQDEVQALAEWLQAPVASFRGGRGIVSDDHPLGFTIASGAARWAEADLVIGIGSRMELQWSRWKRPPQVMKSICIDIDPAQITRTKADIGIVGDAKAATCDLLSAVQDSMLQRPSRTEEFMASRARTANAIQRVQPQMSYLAVIREVLPRDGILVNEVSQAGFTSEFGFPVYAPRTYINAGHQGTLGFGFPTALGVKVAQPNKAVVSIVGDGGFMFGVQELMTAVQYGINLVTIVFNNSSYGNVHRSQMNEFKGRVIGSELQNPDFVKLAESFGMAGYRATSPEELRHMLAAALANAAPALIEVPIERGSEVSPWPFLFPAMG